MNKQIERQIINAIGEQVLFELDQVQRQLERGDSETALFLLNQINTFLHLSICTYQVNFFEVETFLKVIRNYTREFNVSFFSVNNRFQSLHLCVSKISYLLNQRSNISNISEEIEEVVVNSVGFIDLSESCIRDKIETIFESARIQFDKLLNQGICLNNVWINFYLKSYGDTLRKNKSDFDDLIYEQIIDISMGRLAAVYCKDGV